MSLPIDFVASATALECYEGCPRRFRHRYLDHLPTAGPDTRSAEKMQRGDLFHRLVLWHDLGLDTDVILQGVDDPTLHAQWATYQTFQPTLADGGARVQHDTFLVAHCAGFQVLARIDALVIEAEGGITIYDWKTSDQPNPTRLVDSPQSKVYPYVVWEVMRNRPGVSLDDPARIRFVYWFPSQPDAPFEIPYSDELLDTGARWLERLLATIASDTTFDMTTDRRHCQGCEYVAHCGVTPADGDLVEMDEDYFFSGEREEDSSYDHPVWPD